MSTFVLLHGVPGWAGSWDRVTRCLSDHRILTPDLLGFGAEPSPGTADGLLAPSQARHVLDAMNRANLDRVVLVGHDFGGPVAAHLVSIAPERVQALALFATNAFPDTPIPFPLSTLTAPLVGRAAERLLFSRASLALMLRRGVGRPSVTIDADRYIGTEAQQTAIATIFGNSLRRLRELYAPVEAALRSVTVPSLVGWGDRDPFFPVRVGRRTAELLPGSTFKLYEGAGHFLPEERPEQLAADLITLAALHSAA